MYVGLANALHFSGLCWVEPILFARSLNSHVSPLIPLHVTMFLRLNRFAVLFTITCKVNPFLSWGHVLFIFCRQTE